MAADLTQRIATDAPAVSAGLAELRRQGERWGFRLGTLQADNAQYALQSDPFSGEVALQARWASSQGRASLSVRQDGFVYGEWDVAQPHPGKPDQWVEAVVAWGKPDQMKSELRLLDLPQ